MTSQTNLFFFQGFLFTLFLRVDSCIRVSAVTYLPSRPSSSHQLTPSLSHPLYYFTSFSIKSRSNLVWVPCYQGCVPIFWECHCVPIFLGCHCVMFSYFYVTWCVVRLSIWKGFIQYFERSVRLASISERYWIPQELTFHNKK